MVKDKERPWEREEKAQRLGATMGLSVDPKLTERGMMGQEISHESCAGVTSLKALRRSPDFSLVSKREPVKDFKQRNSGIIFALGKMTLTGCERLTGWSEGLNQSHLGKI